MITVIDGITGSPCYLCGEPIGSGYALHEMAQDQWELICSLCELTTEIGEGK